MPESVYSDPRPDVAAAGAAAAHGEWEILGILRRHWALCCTIFLVTASAFCLLAKQREQFTFSSSAALMVARSFPRTLQNDRELELGSSWDYDSFRNDQVALLLRADVLLDALQRCDQLGPPWAPAGSSQAELVEAFARALTVTAVPKSSRIEIELRSKNPNAVQPALNALLSAFEDAHRREYFFADDARPQTLRTALAAIESTIAEKRDEIQQLTSSLGVTSFGPTTPNPWLAAIEDGRRAHAASLRIVEQLRLEREELQASLSTPFTSADLFSGAMEWQGASSGQQAILSMAQRHAELSTAMQALAPGHPGRLAHQRELESLEQRAVQLRLGQIENLLLQADAEVREAETSANSLAGDLQALERRSAEFLAGFQRGRILEDELPRDLSLRDRLNERLEFFEFETQSPSLAEVAQAASTVDPRGRSNLLRGLALALFFALALALGLPLLWEVSDEAVHTPEDTRRALGMPVAGWVPEAARNGSLKLRLDQLQRVAQALDRDRRAHGARLLTFTAVKGEETLGLVRSLAEALSDLGRRVLVVDAIGAQPSAHPGNAGLLGLLAGAPLQAVVHEQDGDFLPLGEKTGANPDWDRWTEILGAAAAGYDLILVVAPALLVAPSAERLVADADLSVLVVEAESERRADVSRAGRLLRELRPRAVGAILTGVRAISGRSYFRRLT